MLLAMCNDIEQCTSDSSLSYMVVRFYDAETKATKKSGFRITRSGSSELIDLRNDSLGVELALNPLDTVQTFVFDTDTIDYTMQVRYDAEFSIFDPDCDPSLVFTGLDTLSSSFDSTAIIGIITDRQLPSNFEVYF